MPNTETTDPVDPLDPEQPVTPVDPTNPDGKPNPGTNGPLSIDFASSLVFGEQKSRLKRKHTMLQHKNIKMQVMLKKKDQTLFKYPQQPRN